MILQTNKGEIKMKRVEDLKLIEQFLTRLYGSNKSNLTVTNYRTDLKFYLDFLSIEKLEVAEVDLQTLEGYTVYLKDYQYQDGKYYAESTIARRISAVKSFYNYLRMRKIVAEDPTLDLESPETVKGGEATFIPREKVKELIASTKGETHEIRDRLILKLFIFTGIRLAELQGLNKSDIDGTQITVHKGKGNKTRRVFITSDLVKELDDYLNKRDKNIEALFISQKNNRMDRSSIQRVVKKYMKKTKIDTDEFSTHSLRHTYASLMLQNDVDIVTIQKSLGHSSLETTQRYVHTLDESRQKAANVMGSIL